MLLLLMLLCFCFFNGKLVGFLGLFVIIINLFLLKVLVLGSLIVMIGFWELDMFCNLGCFGGVVVFEVVVVFVELRGGCCWLCCCCWIWCCCGIWCCWCICGWCCIWVWCCIWGECWIWGWYWGWYVGVGGVIGVGGVCGVILDKGCGLIFVRLVCCLSFFLVGKIILNCVLFVVCVCWFVDVVGFVEGFGVFVGILFSFFFWFGFFLMIGLVEIFCFVGMGVVMMFGWLFVVGVGVFGVGYWNGIDVELCIIFENGDSFVVRELCFVGEGEVVVCGLVLNLFW